MYTVQTPKCDHSFHAECPLLHWPWLLQLLLFPVSNTHLYISGHRSSGGTVFFIFLAFVFEKETEKYKYKSKEINISWVGQSTIFKLPSPWLHAYVRVHVYVHFKLQHWANKSQTQLTSWAINLSRVVNSEICISADPTFQQVVKLCGQTSVAEEGNLGVLELGGAAWLDLSCRDTVVVIQNLNNAVGLSEKSKKCHWSQVSQKYQMMFKTLIMPQYKIPISVTSVSRSLASPWSIICCRKILFKISSAKLSWKYTCMPT